MEYKEYIEDRLKIFTHFYDKIRIVDPIEKKEYDLNENCIFEHEGNCYNGLGKSTVCMNCISSRAYLTNDTISKYEYIDGVPVTMLATPIEYEGKRYIVEIIKKVSYYDIDSTMRIETEVLKVIDELNFKLMHDELTQVFNRRFLNERLPAIVSDFARKNKRIAVGMADIDHFKLVNDKNGHVAGDKVIQTVAEIISRNVNENEGFTGRYGGEEFYIILPGKSGEDAVHLIEKIREEIEQTPIPYEDQPIYVTVSFGISDAHCEMVSTEELIQKADENLYLAKQVRNKVVYKEGKSYQK